LLGTPFSRARKNYYKYLIGNAELNVHKNNFKFRIRIKQSKDERVMRILNGGITLYMVLKL